MKRRKSREATKVELQKMANGSPSAKKVDRYVGRNFVVRWFARLGGFTVKDSAGNAEFTTRAEALRVARQVKKSLAEYA